MDWEALFERAGTYRTSVTEVREALATRRGEEGD